VFSCKKKAVYDQKWGVRTQQGNVVAKRFKLLSGRLTLEPFETPPKNEENNRNEQKDYYPRRTFISGRGKRMSSRTSVFRFVREGKRRRQGKDSSFFSQKGLVYCNPRDVALRDWFPLGKKGGPSRGGTLFRKEKHT